MKLWLSFVVAATSAAPAHAGDMIIMDPATVCRMAYAGKGAWLDTEALRKCLKAESGLESLTAICGRTEAELDVCSHDYNIAAVQVRSMEKTLELRQTQIEDLEDQAMDLEKAMAAWHRNPWLVGIVGALVGVTATSIVAAQFK